MGLWDDASRIRRHEDELRATAEDAAAARQRKAVDEQQTAVREFIQAMNRLGIPPKRVRFEHNNREKMWFAGVTGWTINGWRYVLTPEAAVYPVKSWTGRRPEPYDLDAPISYGYDDVTVPLTESLRQELADRMK